MKKPLALLMIFALFLSIVLIACNRKPDTRPTQETVNSDTESVGDDDPQGEEPIVDEDEAWAGITAASFTSSVQDYEGTVDGAAFKGVLFESKEYQPKIYLNKLAVKKLRIYARENNYDGLRIHVHVDQTNNAFMIGEMRAANNAWTVVDISLANLYTTTPFWSQSEGTTENYMWFEFIKLPVINVTSFTNDVTSFSGKVEGKTFKGFLFKSADYQPYTYFTETAVEMIQEYAKEKGFNALRVHAYTKQTDNAFVIGGQYYPLKEWKYKDFSIADITPKTMAFWSQSQGLTECYLWFEFVKSNNTVKPSATPVSNEGYVNKNPYFRSDKSFAAVDYSGTVGGKTFTGYRLQSAEYQPNFYFTGTALSAIRGKAEKTKTNVLRIHSYASLTNNGFIVGNTYTAPGQWSVIDVAIEDLDSSFTFWSQSEGTTDVYLWFEYIAMVIPEKVGPINARFFEGVNCTIAPSNYRGDAAGKTINGVLVKSADYQPYFKFTEEGLTQIKAYAQKENKNILRIHSYASLTNNGFIVGNVYIKAGQWSFTDVAVEDLNSSFTFWSQSEGTTDVYLWFEWIKVDIPVKVGPINAGFFEGVNCAIAPSNYRGDAGGKTINGVLVKSADYQPFFKFTEEGLTQIKAYAKKEGKNVLRIHSYASLTNNGFIVGNAYVIAEQWSFTDLAVEDLDNSFTFWSQSEGTTDVYLWFEWIKVDIPEKVGPINARFFEGVNCTIAPSNYRGDAGGETINGVLVKSSDYQPFFKFTEEGLTQIKAYAKNEGKNILRIHAYASLTNNGFIVGNAYVIAEQWSVIDVAVEDLDSSFTFWSQSEGTTDVYLWFEGKTVDVPEREGPINARFFEGVSCTIAPSNYRGDVGGVIINGVLVKSADYQPYFKFTEEGLTQIKAYAKKEGKNILRIHSYASLTNNGFFVGNTYTARDRWIDTDVIIAGLNSNFVFWSQSEGSTNVYLWFSYH